MSGTVLDLFAGPGGWDLGARALGLDPVGLELDDAACATRRAAGLRTMQCDVSTVDLAAGWAETLVRGIIASAPCPTFSAAGHRAGAHLTDVIVRCMHELAAGSDTRAERREESYAILEPVAWAAEQAKAKKRGRRPDRDKARARARRDADMSLLVVEPLRWSLALNPEWIALEQVPEVESLWAHMAPILAARGYSTWTGLVSAERFGVPQTRVRAILLASSVRAVEEPRPTHQRYVPPRRRDDDAPMLFDAPPPERIVVPEDRELLPWVSMAEALGWDDGPYPAPAPTVSGGGTAGHDARRRARGPRSHGLERYNSRDQRDSRSGELKFARQRAMDEPAPTISGQSANDSWVYERPATTIAGDARCWPPGHKKNADDERAGRDGYGDRAGTHAVRLTVEQAAVLQSFPPDYPWQGSKTSRFQQVGNAVPPLLALHVLSAVTGIEIPTREEVADAA